MNTIHCTFATNTPMQKARVLAERVYVRLQILGTRQVRWYRGMLRTYPYPAPRGYGTRGLLVGIYTINTRLEWIEGDLAEVLGDQS